MTYEQLVTKLVEQVRDAGETVTKKHVRLMVRQIVDTIAREAISWNTRVSIPRFGVFYARNGRTAGMRNGVRWTKDVAPKILRFRPYRKSGGKGSGKGVKYVFNPNTPPIGVPAPP